MYSFTVLSDCDPTVYLPADEVHVDDIIKLAIPLIPKIITQQPSTTSNVTYYTTLIGLAVELCKIREPELLKLKINTYYAHLFLEGCVKEVHTIIKGRDLSHSEGIQLIKEHTKSKA